MKKKLSISFILLAITTTVWMFTGCGDKEQDDAVPSAEEMNRTEQPADAESNEEQKSDVAEEQTTDKDMPVDEDANKSADAPDAFPNESAELCVKVESIGDNSVVGNKVLIETLPDGNGEIMLVGVGGDNQELVTVYFEENASYVYQIIRNGGEDVETREGSFSDIGLDMTLDLTGYYKGEDFYADKVVISNVILD